MGQLEHGLAQTLMETLGFLKMAKQLEHGTTMLIANTLAYGQRTLKESLAPGLLTKTLHT